uniref:IRF tryptophan pentad repeat domain-containing protein n=1 Tax=Jaculus jaculus TaxID=51337 RepID=A0A8C5KWT5_JACJA
MGNQKPRILPWLVWQLDQGQLEGVSWLDPSRKRFRIPWKHGLRQDTQMEDFGIFRAWAEASGAYIPGRDKPDLSTWKRNFRSALNRKEGLRLVDDRSKDPYDPHKVYEFVSSGAGDFVQLDSSPETNGGSSISDAQLIAFMEGSGRSPRYTLWFCVGEPWPQDQPWVKRLVMVKVVPTCLRALLDMARVGGASSLENTVDLHISNSQPLSLTSDQYKAYLLDLVEDMDLQVTGED